MSHDNCPGRAVSHLGRACPHSVSQVRTGKLMAAAEIGQRLGVSPTRVKQLLKKPDWPAPYDQLGVGRIWLSADVEVWIARNRPVIAEEPESA